MKNIIKLVLVLGVIGIAFFLYMTRPVKIKDIEVQKNGVVAGEQESVYKIQKDETKVWFEIDELLRGEPFRVIGETNNIEGDILINTQNSEIRTSDIYIDARTFKTDNSQRDGAIVRLIVKSEVQGQEYAILSNTSVENLPANINNGEEFEFTLNGDLTLAGKTNPVSFDVKMVVEENSIKGFVESVVKRSDFALVIPNIPFVANVPDEFVLKADFIATK